MSYQIIHGDNVEVLRGIADGSIHLVVTSPPYDNLRSYGGHSWDFESLASELFRVLVDGGVLCWNVNDAVVDGSETLTSFRQAIHFKNACGFRVHDTMIWHKPNFSNPEQVRYHQVMEYVFVLSKGAPRCFNPIKDKPNKYPEGPWGKNTFRLKNGEMAERACNPATAFGMRGNVWTGNTAGQERPEDAKEHPAMMPHWLARDLIRSWSNTGDRVLDPFLGSGTTLEMAIETAREGVGIEIDSDYCHTAEARCRARTPGFAFA
jgi:site-specific DNA-methyltransferase (adenine-specific)